MKSLYAAMNPNKTKYYYYVLDPDTGAHEFSRTYAEHQKLVAKYANG
jgi:cell division protein YceG involved in septum cleavage